MTQLITDPDRAKRLARAIVSDILLYNPEKIKDGIESDNLFEAIEEELAEGRAHYKTRVSPEVFENYNFFELAIVDVLFKNTGKYESKIW